MRHFVSKTNVSNVNNTFIFYNSILYLINLYSIIHKYTKKTIII